MLQRSFLLLFFIIFCTKNKTKPFTCYIIEDFVKTKIMYSKVRKVKIWGFQLTEPPKNPPTLRLSQWPGAQQRSILFGPVFISGGRPRAAPRRFGSATGRSAAYVPSASVRVRCAFPPQPFRERWLVPFSIFRL